MANTEETTSGNGEKKELTKAEKKALFKTADEYQSVVDDALKAVDEAKLELSAAIQEIADQVGNGPFELTSGSRKGEIVRISNRNDVYFFKGMGKAEVERI